MPVPIHTLSLGLKDAELELLEDTHLAASDSHDLITAPLITRDVVHSGSIDALRQYAVYGKVLSIHSKDSVQHIEDSRLPLYINMNTPFSAVVCGVQGSGKSHSVGVLIENALVKDPRLGAVEKPLSALVLHFGEGGGNSKPCEAAYQALASRKSHVSGGGVTISPPPVVVYCSPSSLGTIKRVYAPLGKDVTILPLKFDERELDAESFLAMMAVDGSSESAPLYVKIILSILRQLGEDNYTYRAFLQELQKAKVNFNPAQLAGLEQRLALLESFLKKGPRGSIESRFKAGQLTIVDLTDSFLDPASACGLFEIVSRKFVSANVGTGKILVVDEAHKYLSRGESRLTRALLSYIRQQRHLAMRVIISTQEPTVVPPSLLDLSTITILHRFSSRAWWQHLANHVPAELTEEGFDQVVKLKTGEALVFAPTALAMVDGVDGKKTMDQLGRRYLAVKSRSRVTADGGSSVLVVS